VDLLGADHPNLVSPLLAAAAAHAAVPGDEARARELYERARAIAKDGAMAGGVLAEYCAFLVARGEAAA